MKNCEYVLFVRKGKAKAITDKGCKTVHLFKNPTNKFHETEKPTDLLSMYIKNSSNENDWILDPFAGSGATAVASLLTNRRCFTCEIDDKYAPTIVERLKSVIKTGFDLVKA
jgi:site-specific DNA-methyltransferase (adenine-specific)